MADGDGDRAELERQLVELTRRISELETRIAHIEAQPAAETRHTTPEAKPAQPSQQAGHIPPAAAQPQGAQPMVNRDPWQGLQFQQAQQLQAQQWQAQQQGWPAKPGPQQPPQPQQPGWRRPDEAAQRGWGQPTTPGPSARPAQPQQPSPASPPAPGATQRATYAGEPPQYGRAHTAPPVRPAAPSQRPPVKTPSLAEELGISLASLRDLESRMTGRLLAWVGAAAVVLGSVFFLSLAFSRGWIGPEGRVALGLIGGAACTAAGAWMFGRRQESLGHVLVAAGLGIVSLSLFAGTRYYALYPPEWALAGSFVAAVVVAAIAVRVNSEAVAIFGLLAIAAAPPIMGAGANTVTIAFLAVTIVGTTVIALAKSWRWLPPTAFLITSPQLIYWLLAKPDAVTAVAAIAAYWLLNAVAASADELRAPEDRVEGRAESLFLANSILAIGGGLYLLSGNLAAWQGAFVAGAALAHFAFGGYFIWRRGELNPFGVFINAIGAAAVAIAIERQFTGAAVVIGWSIEGVVLAAIFGRRRNIYAGSAAAILGALSLVHFCIYEYAFLDWSLRGRAGAGRFAFDDPAGMALAGLLITGFLAGWMSKRTDVRLALLTVGSVLSAYSLPFELSGPALLAAWAILGAALVGVWRSRPVDYLGWTAVGMGTIAVVHLGLYEYPVDKWFFGGATGPGAFPFDDSAGLALGCLLAAGALAGWLSRNRDVRFGLLFAGSLVLAYALPFELSGPALVAGWSAEAVALTAVWGFRRSRPVDYLGWTAVGMGTIAVVHLGLYEYVWSQWFLGGATGPGAFPFDDSAGLALGCLLAAGALAAWLSRNRDVRFGLLVAGSLVLGYALPFELSGPALVAGWCAEAVALTAVWGFRRHVGVALSAATIGIYALAHFVAFEYVWSAWSTIGTTSNASIAFFDSAGLALACLLLALALAGALSRNHDVRCGLTTAGLLLVAYSLPFELSGIALVAGWALLLPVSVAAEGLLDRLPGVPASRAQLRRVAVFEMNEAHWPDSPLLAAGAGAVLAIVHLLAYDLPLSSAAAIVVPATPFADLATASAAVAIASFLLAAAITARPDIRVGTIITAAALAAYTAAFELALPYAVVAWCALAVALGAWSFWERYGRWAYVATGATLVTAATVAVLAQIDPLWRLGVQSSVPLTGLWFTVNSTLAIGSAVLAVTAAARFLPLDKNVRSALTLGNGVALVYLASTLVVGFFQAQAGGQTALEELQKQAQVSVSILWGAIGMAVFLAGIVGWRQGIREAGLGLLILATGKVFIFDLSYLDVAYRVLSLVGLGVLLLVGAYAYQTLRPHRPAAEEPPDEAAAG